MAYDRPGHIILYIVPLQSSRISTAPVQGVAIGEKLTPRKEEEPELQEPDTRNQAACCAQQALSI